jgi:hypothetical protein
MTHTCAVHPKINRNQHGQPSAGQRGLLVSGGRTSRPVKAPCSDERDSRRSVRHSERLVVELGVGSVVPVRMLLWRAGSFLPDSGPCPRARPTWQAGPSRSPGGFSGSKARRASPPR